MPKSLMSAIEEVDKKVTPSKDAPTRFDFYDLERAMVQLTEMIEDRLRVTDDLPYEVSRLSDQVDTLSNSVHGLKDAVRALSDRITNSS